VSKKRAVVTGGSRGIGRSILVELAKNYNCDVVFSDIAFPNDDLEATEKSIREEVNNPEVEIFGFKADATTFSDAEATINFAVEKFGGLDILVNNAGITKDTLLMRMTEDDFDKVVNVNLKSVFNYSKAVIKPFMKQKYGRIVNISSVVGIIGNPGQANYASSKAGVIGFTKTMAKEFASRNITVNAIAPGFIQTAMTDKLTDDQKKALLSNVPLGRMGTPEDIARVTGFLISEAADYITGQVIKVDGGMVM
jgi:3-oxoacyl-[acyl-carrier protein] reductase